MLLPLIITLGIMAIVSYVLTSGRLYSCSFLTNIIFLLSSILLLLRDSKWGINISFDTYIVIVVGNSMVMIGELIVLALKQRRATMTMASLPISNHLEITTFACNTLCLLSISLAAFYLFAVYQTIRRYSFSSYALMSYRIAGRQGYGLYSNALIVINIISSVMAYIFAGIIISHIKYKIPIRVRHFIPIICHIAIQIMSSARYGLLTFAGGIIVMYILMENHSKEYVKGINRKLIKNTILAFLLAILSFWFAGTLTGKTGDDTDFIDTIVIYAGSPILALDRWISQNSAFGTLDQSEALLGLANLLNRLGISGFNAGAKNRNAIIVYRNGGSLLTTNIYTCYRAYLHDFSYIGTYLVRLFFGMFYAMLLNPKNEGRSAFQIYRYIICVSMLSYPIFMQITEECFFNELFTITTAVTIIVYLFVFNRAMFVETNNFQDRIQ